MKTPTGGQIGLSTFYWVFFFILAFIKFYYFRGFESAMQQAISKVKSFAEEL
jgi:hypothetical protein